VSLELTQCIRDLVDANHILFRHGIVDAFGHVSVRHPSHPEHFLMSRRVAPKQVTDADIRGFGLDGELLEKDGTPVFLERFIHSAIYNARPDVQAIVHGHSPTVVAFSVVPGNPLRAVCHTCGFLRDGAPNFEIRDVAGDATNLLIETPQLGAALAKSLGRENVVLMRGHGSTVIGTSIPHVVYRAIYTETNARVQSAAAALGSPTFLSQAEADAGDKGSLTGLQRAWDLWKADCEIEND
jgi:ribulose-5-phosphate 4-epimerase/fuculose-1-phosphate aldolase